MCVCVCTLNIEIYREIEIKIFDIHNKVISHDKDTMRVYIPI